MVSTSRALACLAALSAVLLVETVRGAGRPQQRERKAASFYYFARSWPQTICETKGCVISPQRAELGISGLWPASDTAASPYTTFCSGPDVPVFEHRDQISSLLLRLRVQWPWFTDTIDELFYAQEFQKHGSCSITRLSVEDYFTTALDLHRRYPFLSTLEYASIVPSETMTYNVAKLQRILFSVWGVKPVVKCSCPGGWGADCEEAPLESILICIDADLNAVACSTVCKGPGCERTNCKRMSYYPLVQRQGAGKARTGAIPSA